MGYTLRMTAEIAEWLGDLRESDPVTATEVAAALVAVMAADDAESLWLVTRTDDPATADPRDRLDHTYQRMLEALQLLRRQNAQAAIRRKQLQLQLGEARASAEPDRDVLAKLERKLAAAGRREDVLTAQSQRVQAEVDAFRTQKEVAKAVATAARAQHSIGAALRAAGIEPGDFLTEAAGGQAVATAEAQLARAEQLLVSVMASAGVTVTPGRTHRDAADPEVLELHADPLGADVRILFGLQPAGTAVLLAVLEGADAIADHRDEAVSLAADLLAEIRENGWSSASADAAASGPEFADPGTFLETRFPDNASVIAQRATELASVALLRSLRGERDLAEMASAAGIEADRLRHTERIGLREARVRDAAAYVRALGGRLELTAVIGGERHVLASTPSNEPS
jgi:hypothetical protein